MSALGDYLIGILECKECKGMGCKICNPLDLDFDPKDWRN